MLSCVCNRNVILRKKHAYVKECVCVIVCVCVCVCAHKEKIKQMWENVHH